MRTTTVGQLREALEDFGDDVEIRIMHQESYPLQEVIGGIYDPSEQGGCQFDEGGCGYQEVAELHNPKSADFDHAYEGVSSDDANVVYLAANGHPQEGSPYGVKTAWENLRRL